MLKPLSLIALSIIILVLLGVTNAAEWTVWLTIGIFGVLIINEFIYLKPQDEKPGLTFFINNTQINQTMKIQKSMLPVKGHISPSADFDDGIPEAVENGSVQYSSDNEAAVVVGPDPDDPENKLKFQLSFGGTLGTANVKATADADLSEGVKTLTDSIEVEVIEDEAARLNMSLDLPGTGN